MKYGTHLESFVESELLPDFSASDGGAWADRVEECAQTGEDIPLEFDVTSRDSGFGDEDLFAVYSKKDVEALVEHLKEYALS